MQGLLLSCNDYGFLYRGKLASRSDALLCCYLGFFWHPLSWVCFFFFSIPFSFSKDFLLLIFFHLMHLPLLCFNESLSFLALEGDQSNLAYVSPGLCLQLCRAEVPPGGEGWGGQHRVWERNTHLISGMWYLYLQRNRTVGFKIKMSFFSNSTVITSDRLEGFLCLSAAKRVLQSEQANAVQIWKCGGVWLIPALLSLTFHAANDGSWWRCLAVPCQEQAHTRLCCRLGAEWCSPASPVAPWLLVGSSSTK